MKTKKEAFAKFGVIQRNHIWSWSGVSQDRSTVVLTVWTDQYERSDESGSYVWSTFGCDNEEWINSNGNKARIKDIRFALGNHAGHFRAIVIEPCREFLPQRKIKSIRPVMHLEWIIDGFNPKTGECAGHSIPEIRRFSKNK